LEEEHPLQSITKKRERGRQGSEGAAKVKTKFQTVGLSPANTTEKSSGKKMQPIAETAEYTLLTEF